MLSSRETYELYEKRTVTPPRGAPIGYIPAPTHPISPPPITPIRHHGQHSSTFPGGDPKAGQAFCGGPYNIAPPPPKSNSPSVRFDDSINNIEPQMYDGKYSVKRDNEGNFTQKITTMFPSLKGKESCKFFYLFEKCMFFDIFLSYSYFLTLIQGICCFRSLARILFSNVPNSGSLIALCVLQRLYRNLPESG